MTEPAAGARLDAVQEHPDRSRQPYPLLRRFVAVGGPVFALFLVVLAVGSVLAMRGTVEDVYLQLAEQRASGLATGVRERHPVEWARLLDGGQLEPAALAAVTGGIAAEAREFRLERLKVYDVAGRTLFSSLPGEIGKIETGAALRRVLQARQPGLVRFTDPEGRLFYELYVPFIEGGRLAAVFELYEPISYLDAMLLAAAGPAAAVPAVLLLALLAVLFQLARRAQRDIDWRTARIAELTERVERLVSRRAVRAMHGADTNQQPDPRLVTCTLLFSDIRGFTRYAEQRPPREVIETLNRIVAAQVELLETAGADVDKFIGDAVFASFEGPDRAAAAVAAAQAIQRRVADGGIVLPLGIGIASGTVVAGLIGAADRYDYTVLGDAVNVASRLCDAAGPGEIVLDRATADAAAFTGGAVGAIVVKGRDAPVPVVRLAAPAPA